MESSALHSNKLMERVSPVILSGDEGCENAHQTVTPQGGVVKRIVNGISPL
jgi:hypothetical protein